MWQWTGPDTAPYFGIGRKDARKHKRWRVLALKADCSSSFDAPATPSQSTRQKAVGAFRDKDFHPTDVPGQTRANHIAAVAPHSEVVGHELVSLGKPIAGRKIQHLGFDLGFGQG